MATDGKAQGTRNLLARATAILDLASSLGGLGLLAWVWLSFSRLGDVEFADPAMREVAGWIWLVTVPGLAMTAGSVVGLRLAWRGAKPGIARLAGSALLVAGLLVLSATLLLAGLDWPRGWEHAGIGTRLNDRGRHAEALPHFEKALAILGDDPESLVGSGVACTRLGDRDQARVWFDRALAAEPDNPLALLGRARVRRLQGDLDGAREDFEASVLCAPARWIEAPLLEEERKAHAR